MLALVEDSLAAWRLVRLVRDDYITQPVRDHIYDALDGDAPGEDADVGTCECGHPREQHGSLSGDPSRSCATDCDCERYRPIASARVARLRHPKLTTLLECPHCLAVWGAGGVMLLRRLGLGWVVRLLAISAVGGELARRTS